MLLAAMRMAVRGVRRSCPSDASSVVLSSSLWRVSSRCFALLEKLRALDGDGDHSAKCVERAGLDRATGRGKQADRLRSDAQRYEADRYGRHRHRPVAGIGSRLGIELERGLGGLQTRRQLARVERDRTRLRLRRHPTRSRAAAQSRRTPDRTGGRSSARGWKWLRDCRSSPARRGSGRTGAPTRHGGPALPPSACALPPTGCSPPG